MVRNLDNILKQKKIRPTAIRLLVLEYLLGQDVAISLTDLYQSFENSDRVTLYRTLKVFEEYGLVHSINDGTLAPKYALCPDSCDSQQHQDAHIHFHCDICGQTYCLPKSSIPGFELPEHFIKREVNLVVKGTCAACKINVQ
uniref:Transcriptional repressor n=1 Tax=Roseihalotalea indica TaxID=2867963 RepID=A0AA49JHQ1_9BACT|nr:transcriptional repressor [Tunicatimonas sp. TK19036]